MNDGAAYPLAPDPFNGSSTFLTDPLRTTPAPGLSTLADRRQ
ncbi:hypothetical protein [Chondromyces apiculatus]|uniref:Uncharacterized protein n=1 Tax=Chondromyces apiculatus DSM 436 TaxID=1192034 RepID=A0A017SWN0_9BACT|nr:hypothetical protein [Chondromyces apiculatus]EYF00726.1 Hypothetical protein CAP_0294 [Chondromyces apiculatus DSM 436]